MFSRKWWKRIIVGTAVALTLSVAGTIIEWKSTRSKGEELRDAAFAQLDLDDPNWRAADLTSARNAGLPPPERNAAERALEAYKLLPPSYVGWTREEKWQGDLKPGVLPHEADLCEAEGVFADCEEALALARSLRTLPNGGLSLTFQEPDLIGTPLNNTQNMREIAALLSADVTLLASMNRPNEAIQSCHAILNLARGGIGDEPTLISQLVRYAITSIAVGATQRTLGLGTPTAGLADLQAAYAQELSVPRLVYGLRGERAMMARLLENVDNGTLSYGALVGAPTNGLIERLSMPYLRKHLPAQQAQMIEMYNAYIAAERLSGAERKAAIDVVKLPPRGPTTIFIYLLMPALEKVSQAETRVRAQLATAVVGLACERYRQKFGKWPETLADVPTDILPTQPADPYTGNALLYAKFDDCIAVYTTGEDLIDHKAADLTPGGQVGTDTGFRLFNPDQRRREPRPKPDAEGDATDGPGRQFNPPPPDER